MSRIYRLPLRLISQGKWLRISHTAKAVLPAIAIYADDIGEAFPGMKIIRQLSGCVRPETARAGIRSLVEIGLIQKGREGRHNVYYLKPPAIWTGGSYYPMSEEFINTGWRSLSSIEKAVFAVLAVKASMQDPDYPDIDPDDYDNLPTWALKFAEVEDDEGVFGHARIQRKKWERLAGVSHRSWDTAVKRLFEKGQIVLGEENVYMIHRQGVTGEKQRDKI